MPNPDAPAPALPLVTLDELPSQRRDALLWRHALELDYDEVDALVRERSTKSCQWRWLPPSTERVAVLGDDGRYHLLIDGAFLCTPRRRPRQAAFRRRWRPPPDVWHEQWCGWWTDGSRYRVQAPADARREDLGRPIGWGVQHVGWSVTLTEQRTDPNLVPRRERCPIAEPRGQWPPPQDLTTPLGRTRARLIEALGADCHACRRCPGTMVDHDPFTAYARGLLCRNCNTHVDECPHLSGCPWADYLADPPAAPLRLLYPSWRSVLNHPSTRRKIERLGIDPFADLRVHGPRSDTTQYQRSV
ncbi:endonuclease VII domain-containing protein [Actinoallomurus sp. NBC_01490]|uniref:endonuclease domain-containing protein n=1 Tax=Actinoallomurus sp. NBC_01490 TaxID=2903557 RepID=UPI002E332633|nr:endonuclease domain-containing protein [Actinoallomurus sp. NBC_01490]